MSELQKNAKAALASVKHYAVIQSHGKDRALVLHPELGKMLIELGTLKKLIDQRSQGRTTNEQNYGKELKKLIGPVLRELSKK